MKSADTTSEARQVQLDAYRSMTPAERVAIAISMSEAARIVTLDGQARRERQRRAT